MLELKIYKVFCVHICYIKSCNKSIKLKMRAEYYSCDGKYYYHLPIKLFGCEYILA